MIVVITEFCDVNQTFYIDFVELDEQAKTCDRSNSARELIADMVLHVFALEPIRHAIAGCICPPLRHRTDFTQRIQIAVLVGIDRLLGQRLLPRVSMQGLVFLVANQVPNRSVHQQIGVAPYG